MEEIYYVEIHPATPKELEKVVNKKKWLKNFLSQHVPELTNLLPYSQFYWIASGKMAILPDSKEFKELATKVIKLTGLLKIS